MRPTNELPMRRVRYRWPRPEPMAQLSCGHRLPDNGKSRRRCRRCRRNR